MISLEQTEERRALECDLLATLLAEPILMDECILNTDDFLFEQNKNIFSIMRSLVDKGMEITSIAVIQENKGDFNAIGGMTYLNDLIASHVTSANFHYSQARLKDYSLLDIAKDKISQFFNGTSVETIKEDVERFTTSLQNLSEKAVFEQEESTYDLIARRCEEHTYTQNEGLSGVHTGFTTLNKLTDGWQLGDLVIIGARPSVGKTAVSLNMMMKGVQLDTGIHATFFSCEMTKEKIIDRLIAAEAKINLQKMRNPNKAFNKSEWDTYYKATDNLLKLADRYKIPGEIHLTAIKSLIRKIVRDNPDKKHVFYIDHLDHIRIDGKFQSKHHEISEIVHELKQIAKKLKVVIVLLCQLNRAIESRQDKRPMMADLRESGSIEQVADVVVLLHRPDYQKDSNESQNTLDLNFAKNRDGSTGNKQLYFRKEFSRLDDMDKIWGDSNN